MKRRPRIKIELTTADKIAEAAGWSILLVSWIWVAIHYAQLPETIPTHFNAAGKVDGYGDKSMIWGLLAVSTVLFAGMTILNRFPHIFNYLVKITEENALWQYTHATRMIRYLKLILAIIFGMISFITIQYANGKAEDLGKLLPFLLIATFIPLVYFIVKSLQGR